MSAPFLCVSVSSARLEWRELEGEVVFDAGSEVSMQRLGEPRAPATCHIRGRGNPRGG